MASGPDVQERTWNVVGCGGRAVRPDLPKQTAGETRKEFLANFPELRKFSRSRHRRADFCDFAVRLPCFRKCQAEVETLAVTLV